MSRRPHPILTHTKQGAWWSSPVAKGIGMVAGGTAAGATGMGVLNMGRNARAKETGWKGGFNQASQQGSAWEYFRAMLSRWLNPKGTAVLNSEIMNRGMDKMGD